jgi:hypothetical protein
MKSGSEHIEAIGVLPLVGFPSLAAVFVKAWHRH